MKVMQARLENIALKAIFVISRKTPEQPNLRKQLVVAMRSREAFFAMLRGKTAINLFSRQYDVDSTNSLLQLFVSLFSLHRMRKLRLQPSEVNDFFHFYNQLCCDNVDAGRDYLALRSLHQFAFNIFCFNIHECKSTVCLPALFYLNVTASKTYKYKHVSHAIVAQISVRVTLPAEDLLKDEFKLFIAVPDTVPHRYYRESRLRPRDPTPDSADIVLEQASRRQDLVVQLIASEVTGVESSLGYERGTSSDDDSDSTSTDFSEELHQQRASACAGLAVGAGIFSHMATAEAHRWDRAHDVVGDHPADSAGDEDEYMASANTEYSLVGPT